MVIFLIQSFITLCLAVIAAILSFPDLVPIPNPPEGSPPWSRHFKPMLIISITILLSMGSIACSWCQNLAADAKEQEASRKLDVIAQISDSTNQTSMTLVAFQKKREQLVLEKSKKDFLVANLTYIQRRLNGIRETVNVFKEAVEDGSEENYAADLRQLIATIEDLRLSWRVNRGRCKETDPNLVFDIPDELVEDVQISSLNEVLALYEDEDTVENKIIVLEGLSGHLKSIQIGADMIAETLVTDLIHPHDVWPLYRQPEEYPERSSKGGH